MKTWHKVLVVALGISAAKVPAQAQWTNPYTGTTWNNPMSSYLDTVNMGNQRMADLMIQQSIQRNAMKRRLNDRKGKSTAPKSGTKSHMPTTPAATPVVDEMQSAVKATNFKFETPSVMPQQLAQMMSRKVEDRPKTAQVCGWCLRMGREDLLKNPHANLPPDNVARALAYAFISWHDLAVTRNGEKVGQRGQQISVAQADALRMQIAKVLSADPQFRAKSNRQKQELYEVLLIMTTLTQLTYGIGLQKNSVEIQELARGMARDNIKALLGVKPEKMRFTEAGLQF